MCRECGIIKLVGCLIPFVGNKQNMLKLKKRKEKKEIKKNDCKLPLQGNNAILQKWSVFIANKKLLKRKPKPEKIKTIGTAYPSRAPVFTIVFSLFLCFLFIIFIVVVLSVSLIFVVFCVLFYLS
jgi:hypothetical protein